MFYSMLSNSKLCFMEIMCCCGEFAEHRCSNGVNGQEDIADVRSRDCRKWRICRLVQKDKGVLNK